MNGEEECPEAARVAAEAVCGPDTRWKLLTNRRDSAVWHVAGASGDVAVKAGAGEQGAAITGREAEALAAIEGPRTLFAHGSEGGAAWMVTAWHDGPTTWEALHTAREAIRRSSAARVCLADVCTAVARLHGAGWVHGDLQPEHTLHTTDGVRLIDYSWAWHPTKLAPSPLFRGGPPHLLAPELARSIHDGVRPVAPTQTAEVYALAASLWRAITGDWPLDYAHASIEPGSLTASELREVIATQQIALCKPDVWPDAQIILRDAMVAPAGSRPTAAAMSEQLRGLLD
ncbi:hypothetical protein [Streptomyces sp. NPDC048527]|uniref:hypothetical protein n=1 Tax=Streptomyces sp. NPDC048527 TaxID=3365568 RepID=UPI003712E6C1